MNQTITSSIITGLEGRLVPLFIEDKVKNSGIGILDNKQVYVTNAGNYVGKTCIVHFDAVQKENCFRANFINSKTPENFQDISPYGYILYGILPKVPDPIENLLFQYINHFFQPGDIGWTFFFYDKGARHINPKNNHRRTLSFEELIYQLPDPYKSARVALFSSKRLIPEFQRVFLKHKIQPVEMEPISLTAKYL